MQNPTSGQAVLPEWYVYLVRCGDGSQYAGIAKDVLRRVAEHDAGQGARYTRGRGPVTLIAAVGPLSHGDALRLEMKVKKSTAERKLDVLRQGGDEVSFE